MKLKILLPTQILLEKEVDKVTAEAQNGSFSLLPNHIDFVTALAPGLLSFEMDGKEEFVALDEGVLIKKGQEVLVSTKNAVKDAQLGELKRTVKEKFKVLDEQEKKVRSAIAKIEAGFVRQFLRIQKQA